jgi:hypothetical protein
MTMRIRVAGLGDIAPETVWGSVELSVAANGEASLSQIAVRDVGFTPYSFVTGSKVEVDLGPGTRNIWGGYLIKSSRQAWFPADDPDRKHRRWGLSLVDNNILFAKRIAFRKSNPSKVEGPLYKATAYDDDVIATLVEDWLDLSFDDIDTVSRVQRVASIYWGQPIYPYNGGMTWGEAMDSISQFPAAVFALDPDWNLVYGDVDDENAPFALKDRPGPGDVGYREFTHWADGTKLGNDVYAWGFGKGSNHPVFRHLASDASISDHLLWQEAVVAYDIWKQDTIDKVADSILNGSPSSKRGRKNDREAIDLTIHEHGLRIADRVHVVNAEYGVDDVYPIRKMKINPVNADDARYEMTLSHEIDRWGFGDPSPPFSNPNPSSGPGTDLPGPCVGPGCDDGPGPGGCADAICGITDTFNRAGVPSDPLGTSDAGIEWVDGYDMEGVTYYFGWLNNGLASIRSFWSAPPDSGPILFYDFPFPFYSTITSLGTEFDFVKASVSALVDGQWVKLTWQQEWAPDANNLVLVELYLDGALQASWTGVDPLPIVIIDVFPGDGSFPVELNITGSGVEGRVNGRTISFAMAASSVTAYRLSVDGSGDLGTGFDDLNIRGLNRCAGYCVTDSFNRSDGPVGTADCGIAWETSAYLYNGQMIGSGGDGGAVQAMLPGSIPFPVHAVIDIVECPDYLRVETTTASGLATVTLEYEYDISAWRLRVSLSDGTNEATGYVGMDPHPTGILTINLTNDSLTASLAGHTATVSVSESTPGTLATITSATDWFMEWGASTPYTGRFDNLNIASLNRCGDPNHPCYRDCTVLTPVFTDTFQRSVTGSFGTADTGQAWTCEGETASIVVGSGHAEVLVSTDPLVAYSVASQKVYVDVADGCAIEVDLHLVSGITQDWWAGLAIAAGDDGQSIVETGQIDGVVWPSGLVPTSMFTLRLVRSGASAIGSIVQDGIALWTSSPAGSRWDSITLSQSIADWSGTNPGSVTVSVDGVRMVCLGCVDILPEAGGGGGASTGQRTDIATRVSSTIYQLAMQFVERSPKVSVDGLKQTYGVTYTEDAATGQIIFNDPLDPSDTVVVTYYANGSL